jgi:hypothetical protein
VRAFPTWTTSDRRDPTDEPPALPLYMPLYHQPAFIYLSFFEKFACVISYVHMKILVMRSGGDRLVWLSPCCAEYCCAACVDVPIRPVRVVADRVDVPIRPIVELS